VCVCVCACACACVCMHVCVYVGVVVGVCECVYETVAERFDTQVCRRGNVVCHVCVRQNEFACVYVYVRVYL